MLYEIKEQLRDHIIPPDSDQGASCGAVPQARTTLAPSSMAERSEVKRLPHRQLRHVLILLLHIHCRALRQEFVEVLPVVRHIALHLQLSGAHVDIMLPYISSPHAQESIRRAIEIIIWKRRIERSLADSLNVLSWGLVP